MPDFEFEHFYPDLEQQKFWDFLIDSEWYTQSDIMQGEVTLLTPGKDHPQGVGAVRTVKIGKTIDLIEKIEGFDPPRYFSYATQNGGKGMPVKDYLGEFFLEPKDGGLHFRYRGSFKPTFFGSNWLVTALFRWRMKTMVPIWEKGYKSYHGIEG